MSKKSLAIIIDGNALLHRAWHAIPPLTASDGRVVNAVYGFVNVIEKVRTDYAPDYLAVAWDLPGKTFRHELYEAYKGKREKKEQELYDQIPMIQTFLQAYHIPSISIEGMEADDILGSLSSYFCEKTDADVRILTGDMDALQLVNECVHVIAFVKGLSETKEYDSEAVKEKFGVLPEQMIDLKTLMGDNSDNIPGIAGIGKKTAAHLISEYESVIGILKAKKEEKLSASIAKKLENQEETLKTMRKLVTIVRDLSLPVTKKEMQVQEADIHQLTSLLREFGFRRLLAKYGEDTSKETPPASRKKKKSSLFKKSSLEKLKKTIVYVMIEKKSEDLFGATVSRIHLCDGERMTTFEDPTSSDIKAVNAFLDRTELIIGHDLKSAMHALGELKSPVFDVMVAAYLLNPGTRSFDLPTIAFEYAKTTVEGAVSPDEHFSLLLTLSKKLETDLKKEGMEKLAEEIEMPLIAVLYQMEKAGIAVDRKHLAVLSRQFETEIEKLTKRIHKAAGKDFNINSPSQLADVLFDTLKLPTKGIKKTKSGYSTAASELEKLWDAHEIVPLMSEYREIAKLKSTYVDTLPSLIAKDGRIHTTYNQTIAATGRLSSTDPNLQNIPIRTELGNEIRKAFIPRDGAVLVAADYSQFELRLAAIIAKDKSFIQAFQDGADIHRRTAAEVLQKSEEEVTKEERSAAKAINFGILYGMGPRNLARSTGFSQEEAKKFIERYFEMHPGIKNYIETTKALAHKRGYVETIFGRKRYLPDLSSGIPMLRAASERMAVNMPLQGTQADLIKMAMLRVSEWIEKEKRPISLLLQVHDELVFEMEKEEAPKAMKTIREIMESVWKTEVPFEVNIESGINWADLK